MITKNIKTIGTMAFFALLAFADPASACEVTKAKKETKTVTKVEKKSVEKKTETKTAKKAGQDQRVLLKNASAADLEAAKLTPCENEAVKKLQAASAKKTTKVTKSKIQTKKTTVTKKTAKNTKNDKKTLTKAASSKSDLSRVKGKKLKRPVSRQTVKQAAVTKAEEAKEEKKELVCSDEKVSGVEGTKLKRPKACTWKVVEKPAVAPVMIEQPASAQEKVEEKKEEKKEEKIEAVEVVEEEPVPAAPPVITRFHITPVIGCACFDITGDLVDNSFANDGEKGYGIAGGVYAEFRNGKSLLGVETGVLFVQTGAVGTDGSANAVQNRLNYIYNDYVYIPVNAKLYAVRSEKFDAYVKAGILFGFLTDSSMGTTNLAGVKSEVDTTSAFKDNDFAGSVGLGARFALSDHVAIVADGFYVHSFADISNTSSLALFGGGAVVGAGTDARNQGVVGLLGVQFSF